MFHDETTRPPHPTHFGVGFSGSGTLSSTAYLLEEAHLRYQNEDGTPAAVEAVNSAKRGYGLYGSYYGDGDFAISATLGPAIAGVDGTAKLWRRNYLTVSTSAYGGAQVFFQHRTFNSPVLGAALGLGYRRERHYFDVEYRGEEPSGGLYLTPDYDDFSVSSLGTRASVVLRPGAEYPGVLRGVLYVGYAPAFKHPVINLGVTVGVF